MPNSASEPLPRAAELQLNPGFKPCGVEPGDELHPNGVFEFNVTRMLAFIRAHPERFPIESIELTDVPDFGGDANLDEAAILESDPSRPILLAEIAPGRYDVIDGHHRVAKARREGLRRMPVHRVRCPEHLTFLTSARAYEAYVEYWNSKLNVGPRRPRRIRRSNRR